MCWRTLLRVWCEFGRARFDAMHGIYTVLRLKQPVVTIFGGTRAKSEDHYAQQAEQLARMFVEHGMSVLTGGGPGIMQAANCGARGATLGIGVWGVDDKFENPCARVIKVNHFFVRKWLLMRNSMGFVVFPGGIGTMDELFYVLNHIKHGRIPQLPVVLIGTEYWQPLLTWFTDRALKEGFIKPEYLTFFKVVDDPAQAFALIKDASSFLE